MHCAGHPSMDLAGGMEHHVTVPQEEKGESCTCFTSILKEKVLKSSILSDDYNHRCRFLQDWTSNHSLWGAFRTTGLDLFLHFHELWLWVSYSGG